MLQSHHFIRRKHDDFVDCNVAVLASGAFQVMQELQDIDVHDERFSAPGSAHESQLVQCLFRIRRNIQPEHGLRCDIRQKGVQFCRESGFVRKIFIQINFRKQQSEILEVFERDSAAQSADPFDVAADVFIVNAQLVFADFQFPAEIPQIDVEQCILVVVIPFRIGRVQFFCEIAECFPTELIEKVAEQHQLLLESYRRFLFLPGRHVYASSNIFCLNSISIRRTFQLS